MMLMMLKRGASTMSNIGPGNEDSRIQDSENTTNGDPLMLMMLEQQDEHHWPGTPCHRGKPS